MLSYAYHVVVSHGNATTTWYKTVVVVVMAPSVSYRMTKETHVCPGRQEWPVKIPPMLGNSCFRHGNILFACCAQLLKPRLTYARLCDTIMNANVVVNLERSHEISWKLVNVNA